MGLEKGFIAKDPAKHQLLSSVAFCSCTISNLGERHQTVSSIMCFRGFILITVCNDPYKQPADELFTLWTSLSLCPFGQSSASIAWNSTGKSHH